MAGAGYKLFNTGDVLTAAQVNTYLMEQSIMRFATTAARNTALSGVLAEGMVCYIDADNNLYKYTGSSWVNITASPLTTKGDLYTYSTADARLAAGSNGQQLVADSSATTGLRWQNNYAAGKQKIINSDFSIWQRGTSFSITTNSLYTADRFYAVYSTAAPTSWTVSQQAFTPGTAPEAGYEATYFLRSDVATLGSATAMSIRQRIEDVRTLAGQTATFSFWAKASASITASVTATQEFGTGGSSAVTALNDTVSLTTDWQRFSITANIPSVSGKTIGANSSLQVRIAHPVAASTIDTWGWQLEAGNVSTAFQTATGTLQGELAACQRYYYNAIPGTGAQRTVGNVVCYTTNTIYGVLPFKVSMRTAPTMEQVTGTNYFELMGNNTSDGFDSFAAIAETTTDAVRIGVTSGVSATTGFGYWVRTQDANARLAFSAEL
jgi:hypothetical protein